MTEWSATKYINTAMVMVAGIGMLEHAWRGEVEDARRHKASLTHEFQQCGCGIRESLTITGSDYEYQESWIMGYSLLSCRADG
jgi:hypothetical protein